MAGRFGIHIGNSTICLSVNKDNKVDVVATKFGERCSPALVAATTTDDEFSIGPPAEERYSRDFLFTVKNNLQFLGASDMTEEELNEAKEASVCAFDNDKLQYLLKNVKFEYETEATPHSIAVKLFENLNENAAQAFTSDKRYEAVLAVPVHFSPASRRNMITAATEADFNILQLISQPTAALVAYEIGFNIDDPPVNVLVYRMGGLTSDITLFRVQNGMYEQINYVHLKYGGNRITKLLANYMNPPAVKNLKLTGTKLRDTNIKIEQHAESCKRILSTMQSVQVFMENLVCVDDRCIDSNQTITRARFENSFGSEMQSFLRPIEELLSKHTDISVDQVILCGGGMKVPKVQASVSAMFPNAQILNTIQPDEVISIGCAKQASFVQHHSSLESSEQIDIEIPALSGDVFVINEDDDPDNKLLLFGKGTVLPVEKPLKIVRQFNSDGKASLKVLQQNGQRIDQVDGCGAAHGLLDASAKVDESLTIQFKFQERQTIS